MSKRTRKILILVIVIIVLISLLTKIPFIGQFIADTIGKPIEVVERFADMGISVGVGALLIFLAPVLFTAGAVLAGGLVVVVGLVLVGIGLYRWFTKPSLSGRTSNE